MSDSTYKIQKLMNDYCYRVDSGDLDGMAKLFEHGTFMFVGDEENALVGSKAVRGMLDNVTLYDGKTLTKHVMSNVQIDVDDVAGKAEAESYLTVFQAVPEKFPLQAIFIGHYYDQFERLNSEWRFKRRLISADLVGDIAFHRADMA